MSIANAPDRDCIIVGAGLTGLASAYLLLQAGMTVGILEARSIAGGRVQSVYDDQTGDYVADLGPTWIWPAFQPVVARWMDTLELTTFSQFEAGKAIIDYGPGNGPVEHRLPSQEGIMRITGGPQAIIDALLARLPTGTLVTNARVEAISTTKDNCQISFTDGSTLTSDQTIVALPPRIASCSITWTPDLPDQVHQALNMMPTWMAPYAKAVVTYDKPFWRERGLSGRIASQAGPIVEAHDHSGPEGTPAAIFGFIGWPAAQRAQESADLQSHIRDQVKRCFGPESPEPLSIHIKDWADDPLVASPADISGPMMHPEVGPDVLRQCHGGGRILFAAAEFADQSPGLIDGALAIANQVARQLTQSRKN